MNLFINKKMRFGVLVVMSVLLAVVLMSCPDAAAGDGSSSSGGGSSADPSPVTSVTLHFTNDYKLEDKLKISFPAGTVSNSFTENGDVLSVPQSDVSYSRSGNTHNVILKVRPYYGSDNLTNVANGTGTVKVTPELASSASSSIPANNELAITNNVISFTATHDGATHTYTITLERQTSKVTVDILNVGISTMYASITSNAVNHFVNVFVHDSATADTYANSIDNTKYPTRKTFILKQGYTQHAYMNSIGKHAYVTNPTVTSKATVTESLATLPAFIMRPNTTYYLHVYYKDVHTGAEIKDVDSFTTVALPTEHTGTAPKEFANTWADGQYDDTTKLGGYSYGNYITATSDSAISSEHFTNTGVRASKSSPLLTNYTSIIGSITGLNVTHHFFLPFVITTATLTDVEYFIGPSSSGSSAYAKDANTGNISFLHFNGAQTFFNEFGNTGTYLLYSYVLKADSKKTAHDGIWKGNLGTGSAATKLFEYDYDFESKALWSITNGTNFAPVRPIK